jgi:hypothetical protein
VGPGLDAKPFHSAIEGLATQAQITSRLCDNSLRTLQGPFDGASIESRFMTVAWRIVRQRQRRGIDGSAAGKQASSLYGVL